MVIDDRVMGFYIHVSCPNSFTKSGDRASIPSRQWQTRREPGTQRHGTHAVSRVTEREAVTDMAFSLTHEPDMSLEMKPDAVAAVRRSGSRPHRILMYGGGALRGLGIRDHNSVCPAAPRTRSQNGRVGASISTSSSTRSPLLPRALELLRGLRLRRYDAVVVFLSEQPAERGVRADEWGKLFAQLVVMLRDEVCPGTPVIICDTTQAVINASRRSVFGVRRAVSTAMSYGPGIAAACGYAGFDLVELAAPTGSSSDDGRFSIATWAIWADTLAARLIPRLNALGDKTVVDTAAEFRTRPDPETPRQRALAQMRLRPGYRDPALEYIIAKTRTAFRASLALLNIVDGDTQWAQGSSGPLLQMPREIAFCDHTIRTDSLTLVNEPGAMPDLLPTRSLLDLRTSGSTRECPSTPSTGPHRCALRARHA